MIVLFGVVLTIIFYRELSFTSHKFSKILGTLLLTYITLSLILVVKIELETKFNFTILLMITIIFCYRLNSIIKRYLKWYFVENNKAGNLSTSYFDYLTRKTLQYSNPSKKKFLKYSFKLATIL